MRTLWRLIASFFKWTWRILNFIRKLALNAIFLVLVLVCIGIWSQFSTTTSEHARALLLDITGVVVDKPSASSKLGVIGRQLFGASSDRLQENSLFDIVQTIRQAKDDRNITGIVLDLKTSLAAISRPCSTSVKRCVSSATAANRSMPSAAATARASTGELCQQNLALTTGRG
ncbi:Protease 4 [Klebsiella variicola]|nr:Protease 4 [Klebsiella variicola]